MNRVYIYIIAVAFTFALGMRVQSWHDGAKAAKVITHTVYVERAQNKAVAKVEETHAAAQEKIRYVYRTIIQDVPAHITPAVDRAYPLPTGFVRVHDAAATGSPVPEVPDAGLLDGSPSGVTASAAAIVIAGNYEACRHNAEQLTALQDAVRAQVATMEAKHVPH